MKTPTMPRGHTAINLYDYLENLGQRENLRHQIACKEEDLQMSEQLHEVYKRLGCTSILEVSQAHRSKLAADILLLTLDKNKLEEQLLEFADTVCLED